MLGVSFDRLEDRVMDLFMEIEWMRNEKMEQERQMMKQTNKQGVEGSWEL